MAAKLVLQTLLPTFPLLGDFQVRVSLLTVGIRTTIREGKHSVFVIIKTVPQSTTHNGVEAKLFTRVGESTAKRPLIPLDVQTGFELVTFGRLVACFCSTFRFFGSPLTDQRFQQWVREHRGDEKFETAKKLLGLSQEQLDNVIDSFSLPKAFVQTRTAYEQVLSYFRNKRKDRSGGLWEPEGLVGDGIPIAWRRMTKYDINQTPMFGDTLELTVEEFVGSCMEEWRLSDPALNKWASSLRRAGGAAKVISEMIMDGPEVPFIQLQPDLYCFGDVFITASEEGRTKDIASACFPEWYTVRERPPMEDFKHTELFKIFRRQQWTDHTIWAFMTIWGLTLLQTPLTKRRLQACPYLYGQSGTGKSTVNSMVMSVFQPYETWEFNPGDSADFRTGGLRHCRFTLWSETSRDGGPGRVLFNKLVANENITVNAKHQTPVMMKYRGMVYADGNEPFWDDPKPLLPDGTINLRFESDQFKLRSMARRVVVFPFAHVIDRVDHELEHKLQEELPECISFALYCAKIANEDPGNIDVYIRSEQTDRARNLLFWPVESFRDKNNVLRVYKTIKLLPSYNAPGHRFSVFH